MRTHRQTDTPQCYVLSPATHSAILLHVHINNHDHRLTSLQRMVTHLCRMTWWSVCGRLSGQYMSKERDDRHPGSCPASKRRCEVEWSEIATGWAQTCNVWSTTSRLQQIDRTECLWHRQHDRVTVSLCLSVSLSLSGTHRHCHGHQCSDSCLWLVVTMRDTRFYQSTNWLHTAIHRNTQDGMVILHLLVTSFLLLPSSPPTPLCPSLSTPGSNEAEFERANEHRALVWVEKPQTEQLLVGGTTSQLTQEVLLQQQS